MHPNLYIDLFNLRQIPSDILLETISDGIENHGVRVDNIENLDARIYYHFSYPSLGPLNEDVDAQLDGVIIIDRIKANYEATISLNFDKDISESVKYASLVTKDFDEVLRYVALVNEDIDRLMYRLLFKRAFKSTFNEATAYSPLSNYNQLSDQARQLLDWMRGYYNDGNGPNIFDISTVEFGMHPDVRDQAMDELIRGDYIAVRGESIKVNRTALDSLRAIVSG